MKYKKYNINSVILLISLIYMKEIREIFYSVNYSNNVFRFNYMGTLNCFILVICSILIIKGLFQRLRAALVINIIIVGLVMITKILDYTYLETNIILLSYILLSLIIQNKWFNSKSNPKKLLVGITLTLGAIFTDAIIANIALLGGFDELIIFINLCLVAIIIRLVLSPNYLKQIHSYEDKQKVQKLLKRFATNPVSAVILEDDKQYFFAKTCEGVIGYTIINNIAIVAGEPICSQCYMKDILEEFKKFCFDNSLAICFCQISSKYKQILEENNFIVQEYGKEAIINLDTYTIKGSKTSKIRWANNKMNKLGVEVTEYEPLKERNDEIERQICNISNEWLEMKKSAELSFLLGTISIDKPFDRRYFIANDSKGALLGFVVCFPYKTQKGYFIDITRRSKIAPLGIMEKLTIEICEMLKEDEVKEVSLGLAPLADIKCGNSVESKIIYKIFKFIYKYMNSFYGFKALYDYKKKYNPSIWEPRFIAYSPEATILSIGYAMVKAKHPKGLRKLLYNRLRKFIK